MSSYYPKKLRQIYESGCKGFFPKDLEQSPQDFQKELKDVQVLGYVDVISRGINTAFVELTPKGIEFAQQITNITD